MNREKAIRLKFYDILLAGNITYDSGEISIWDEKAEDTTNNIYILLLNQTAQNDNTYCNKSWTCTIEVEITLKQPDTISKDIADDISEQVENLLYDALLTGVEYEGWQMTNIILDTVDFSGGYILGSTDSEIQKTLIFRLTATKI